MFFCIHVVHGYNKQNHVAVNTKMININTITITKLIENFFFLVQFTNNLQICFSLQFTVYWHWQFFLLQWWWTIELCKKKLAPMQTFHFENCKETTMQKCIKKLFFFQNGICIALNIMLAHFGQMFLSNRGAQRSLFCHDFFSRVVLKNRPSKEKKMVSPTPYSCSDPALVSVLH